MKIINKNSPPSKARTDVIIRQRKVIQEMIKNGGKIGAAMVKAGYSPNTAKSTQKMTNTQTFQQLLANVIPDSKLIKKLDSLLDADVKVYRKGELETVRSDTEAIARALDMGFKLKGSYAPEKSIVMNLYIDKSDIELKQEIADIERELGLSRDENVLDGQSINSDN